MKEYFYEVELNRMSESTGKLSSPGLEHIQIFSSANSPKEHKNYWTAEHLLAASVSACFMNSFHETAERLKLDILAYQSQCFVKLEKRQNKFICTEILLRPLIKLQNKAAMLRAYQCVEETEKGCDFSNLLKISLEVHPQFEYPV